MLPLVALIGRPNVGKSTLFNRFVGYRKAIVSPTPGTTRDRHYYRIKGEKPFVLVDTGGIESKTEGIIENNVIAQAKLAISESDVIVFLIDSKEGMTTDDHHVADLLRKSGKHIILVASKSDSGLEDISEMIGIGFGIPLRVASTHNKGTEDLKDLIFRMIPKTTIEKPSSDDQMVSIAMMGRPNVGKSSLINRLIGTEKLIVTDVLGTTVDSTNVDFEYSNTIYRLVDTAGIRRRGKIQKGIEKYSFMRSLRSSDQADVCILLIDGKEGVTSQDLHVANYVLSSHSGLVLAVNKLDLMEKGEEIRIKFLEKLHYSFDFVPWAPVVFISAKTGKNVDKILELSKEIKAVRSHRIDTGKLNRWLEKIVFKHKPTGTGRRLPKLYYMTQVDINPPHFVIFVNKKSYFHFSYLRYLENQLRESFGFEGSSIRLEFREKTQVQTRANRWKK